MVDRGDEEGDRVLAEEGGGCDVCVLDIFFV